MAPSFPYNPEVLASKYFPAVPGLIDVHNIGLEFERGRIGMNGSRRLASLAIVAALCLTVGSVASVKAQAPAGQDAGAKPQYTMAEYNAYTAAQSTKDPAQQIKQLDDFVAKYPNSALLIYVYPLYYNAYSQLKSYPKVIEYADKLLTLGDKVEPPIRYQAYYARAFAYSNLPPNSQEVKDQAPKA